MLLNDMHTDWHAEDDDNGAAIAVLHTNGSGFWSEAAKAVGITKLRLGYISEDKDFAELCVHFNTTTWRVDADGLIYTDRLFAKELAEWLTAQGYAGDSVSYSEQGMQGDNYVSLDAGEAFVASYAAKHAEEFEARWKECNE